MPAGNWVVRVRAKNAAFSQRAKIVTSKGGFKLGQRPGSRVKFSTSDFWSLKIQNRPKRKKWRSSKMMKIPKKYGYQIRSEDWTDNDFNDFTDHDGFNNYDN